MDLAQRPRAELALWGLVLLHLVLVAPPLARRAGVALRHARVPEAPLAPARVDPPDLRRFVRETLAEVPERADVLVDPYGLHPYTHSPAFFAYYLYPRRVYWWPREPAALRRYPFRPDRPVVLVRRGDEGLERVALGDGGGGGARR